MYIRTRARRESKWKIGGCRALRRCGCARKPECDSISFVMKFRLGSAGEPMECSHCYDILNEDTLTSVSAHYLHLHVICFGLQSLFNMPSDLDPAGGTLVGALLADSQFLMKITAIYKAGNLPRPSSQQCLYRAWQEVWLKEFFPLGVRPQSALIDQVPITTCRPQCLSCLQGEIYRIPAISKMTQWGYLPAWCGCCKSVKSVKQTGPSVHLIMFLFSSNILSKL